MDEIIFESSANSFVTLTILSGKSLMYITKRSGPKTDPWGTPLKTSVHLELASPIITLCLLKLRKSSNHLAISSVTPYPFILWTNLRWGTKSKAFAKSNSISSTLLPSTKLEVMKSSVSSRLLRQLFDGTKPRWVLFINLLSIRCLSSSSLIILSSILEITEVRDIGL